MKKKELIVTSILVVILIIAASVYNYVFNSEHRNIAQEEALVSMSAQDLFNHFEANETLATTTYLDQVVELKGKVTTIEDGAIVLDNVIQANFNESKILTLKEGQTVTIKGRCVGYDELLELVKIDQSTLIK